MEYESLARSFATRGRTSQKQQTNKRSPAPSLISQKQLITADDTPRVQRGVLTRHRSFEREIANVATRSDRARLSKLLSQQAPRHHRRDTKVGARPRARLSRL